MKRILISALFCAVFAAAAGAQTTEIRYTYDAAGNRISRKSASAVESQAMTQQKTDESVKSGKETAAVVGNSTANSSSPANTSDSASSEEQKKVATDRKKEE